MITLQWVMAVFKRSPALSTTAQFHLLQSWWSNRSSWLNSPLWRRAELVPLSHHSPKVYPIRSSHISLWISVFLGNICEWANINDNLVCRGRHRFKSQLYVGDRFSRINIWGLCYFQKNKKNAIKIVGVKYKCNSCCMFYKFLLKNYRTGKTV